MRQNVLNYRNYRYLRLASLVMALAITAFLIHQPITGEFAYGGTWLGYLFGILATTAALVLMGYGVRKRLAPMREERRNAPGAHAPGQHVPNRRIHEMNWLRHHGPTLQGWLSAHIYLGLAMLVLVTLHTGFQFGWNVHSLAYVLMMVAIVSGCYGIYAYLRFPGLMTANMDGVETFDALMLEIDELDRQAGVKSLQFSDEIGALIQKARQGTLIGGNLFQQLMAYHHNCPTARAVEQLQALGKHIRYDQMESFDELYMTIAQKEALVKRARRDVMYRARMEFWLYVHVPFSIAFLAALLAHIVAIYYFW